MWGRGLNGAFGVRSCEVVDIQSCFYRVSKIEPPGHGRHADRYFSRDSLLISQNPS